MNTPKIRFKGFEDDWEQRKLGTLCSLITKGTTPKDKSGNGEVNFIKVENINPDNGEITVLSKISTEEHERYLKRSKLEEDDVLFSIAGTLGRVSVVKSNVLPANTNQAIAIIRVKKGYIPYLTTVLKGPAVEDFIRKNPTIGAQPNLSLEQVNNLDISYPKYEEQVKIGEYFKSLDNLITLHQRKCDETKQLKKFMLQKMFPKNGEKNPEIRFKGFTDDWEQRKLEDVMDTVTDYVAAGSFEDIRNNVTYLNEPGYAQLVRTVDLKKKFTNSDSVYVDESAFKYLWRVNLNDECIVLPNIGANIGEVYFVEPSGLPYDNNVLGPNAILLKANEDTYFAFTALNNLTFQKQLFENVGSSGQPKFNKTELKSIQLYMPQNEEQVKIGQYFRKLDHLITLHQRKCEKLKELKKFMLQNMFV